MKYQHVWNKDLICDVIKPPTKNRPYYDFMLGDKKRHSNKDIFEREWKLLTPPGIKIER